MRYSGIDCQHDWQAMIDGSDPIGQRHWPSSDEPMTILYTSGSTGQPKGVVISKMPPHKLERLLKIPFIGKRVARKVRQGLGLGTCRLIGSGSAPISPLTLRWYEKIGVHISEGWGMSETSGLACSASTTSRPS